ncbi:HAD-like domain-containing protein [Aspergillus pseudoustus]|uniref:HAD-like domain-containing protein n=1 Tax=Aspergillus pseudoustus TaxID=1810923 RepID=A0ABR4KGZ6_9EURO
MTSPCSCKVVLFDLDGTLFDHHHSLACAISAVRDGWPGLSTYSLDHLVDRYNAALQEAYDMYLRKEIAYEDTNALKVKLFFTLLGLTKPSQDEIIQFRALYKPAYRSSRRGTPGAVETLIRLRELGYRLAIVTNGQIDDQNDKAQDIGVHHLVDRIVTSEEAGRPKPDPSIFQLALEGFGTLPDEAFIVGDSVESDIRGGLDAGLKTILYTPSAQDSQRLLFGVQVPVIRHMSELLGYVDVAETHTTAPSVLA